MDQKYEETDQKYEEIDQQIEILKILEKSVNKVKIWGNQLTKWDFKVCE